MAIVGTLPNNIQNGQLEDAVPVMANFNWIVNQVNANAIPTGTISPGTLLSIQTFTANGAYTPNPNASFAIIEAIGGGGGGGGAASTTISQVAPAQGGGAGSYAKARYSPLASQTVTIGAGGAGGVAGANNGTTGGQTTFGAIITCPGGIGGQGASAQTPPFFFGANGGSSAATTTALGLILSAGAPGGMGIGLTNADFIGGVGASSTFGGGAGPVSGTSPGIAATTKGAGGSGALSANNSVATAGGNGAGGLVVVYEFA